MSRILAIDYGLVRIGLAITDPLGILAQPLPPLKNRGDIEVIRGLKNIIEEKEVRWVLLGLAKKMDGTLGPVGEACLKLADQLKKECNVEVKFLDEAFTSREAEEILVGELNVSREKRKNLKDSLSACLLLRGYLGNK